MSYASTTLWATEFQAVVFAAGKGSRMLEITSDKPKCLLPVGPKPLVWYPLYNLQRSGFSEVILIVLDQHKTEIQRALDKAGGLKLKFDYQTVSSNSDLGTAEILRTIGDRLKSDVLIISCDLVSDVDFTQALTKFRQENASVVIQLFHSAGTEKKDLRVPGPKSKHLRTERDFIAIEPKTDRLVFLASASDFDVDVDLSETLVKKHPNVVLHSNLLDSHVYVIKNWIVKYLQFRGSNFTTIKGELLPHVIKKQLSKRRNEPVATADDDSLKAHSVKTNQHILDFAASCIRPSDQLIGETTNHYSGYNKSGTLNSDLIRCYASIASPNSLGMRINTLAAYWNVHHLISERWDKFATELKLVRVHPKTTNKSTQLDDKTVLWEGADIAEKTSFKNSVIGINSKISSFSRVFNCILMNDVEIGEKVALEDSIVCDGASIAQNCQIKGCVIGCRYDIDENSQRQQETISRSGRYMKL